MKCIRPQLWGTDPGQSPPNPGRKGSKASCLPSTVSAPLPLPACKPHPAHPGTGRPVHWPHSHPGTPKEAINLICSETGGTFPKQMLDVRAKKREGHISILHSRPEVASKYSTQLHLLSGGAGIDHWVSGSTLKFLNQWDPVHR